MRLGVSFLTLLFTFLVFSESTNAADAAFQIRPGDVLHVTVWKEEGMDQETVVLPDGSITFPLVGSLSVQGLTPAQAADAVKDKLKRAIPDAAVSVVVKAPLGHTVSVMGQVAKPGDIVLGQRTTVMQALSQAGGLTPFAKASGVKILRKEGDKETSIDFPYDDVADGDSLDKNIILQPGDVIVVPTAGLF